MAVVRGTKSLKQKVGVVKASHPAGFSKVRCPACKVGIAEATQTTAGTVLRCGRCGREFQAEQQLS